MNTRIVFLGAGRMASAIVRGIIRNQHYLPLEIACTCGDDSTGPELAQATGIQFLPDIHEGIREAEVLVLACKPQQFAALDARLSEATKDTLVVSILAGTTIASLSGKFSSARNIVRSMPNTPGQIGAGVTAYAPRDPLLGNDTILIENILSSLGRFHKVSEPELDAVTALSGSGPAYVFEFAAALRDAGIHCGLDNELARSLAIETLLGSAKLLEQSDESAEELRKAVTSPGGTTAAALEVLENADFRGLIRKALVAAKSRSLELANQ